MSTDVDTPATASAFTDAPPPPHTSSAETRSSQDDGALFPGANGTAVSAGHAKAAALAARRAEVVRLTVEGLSQRTIADRLGMGVDAVRNDQRKSGVRPARDTEDADLNSRAGAVTTAWAKTQAAGLVSTSRRTSVHQLVKRILAAGQFGDDATGAALLRLAGRGIAPTAAALGAELTRPASANGQGPSAQRDRSRHSRLNAADQSIYD